MRVGVRCGDLDLDATVVRDRHQWVDGVQLAALLVGVVHAADPEAQLEAQSGVIAQCLRDGGQLLPVNLQRQLVAEHHHPLDGCGVGVVSEGGAQLVDDVVEIAAVRAGRAAGQRDRADETSVARRVAGAAGPEHAAAHGDDLRGVLARFVLGHRSKPLSSMVGVTASAACSASRIASSRCTPSGIS